MIKVCFHCNKEISVEEPMVRICLTKSESLSGVRILSAEHNFHLNCFIQVAGHQYLPTPPDNAELTKSKQDIDNWERKLITPGSYIANSQLDSNVGERYDLPRLPPPLPNKHHKK